MSANWPLPAGWDDFPEDYEGPSCSICDALGHGYPGGPPCTLEDRGWDDPRERGW